MRGYSRLDDRLSYRLAEGKRCQHQPVMNRARVGRLQFEEEAFSQPDRRCGFPAPGSLDPVSFPCRAARTRASSHSLTCTTGGAHGGLTPCSLSRARVGRGRAKAVAAALQPLGCPGRIPPPCRAVLAPLVPAASAEPVIPRGSSGVCRSWRQSAPTQCRGALRAIVFDSRLGMKDRTPDARFPSHIICRYHWHLV